MASIYAIKPKFQALLRPLSNWLARKRVTPNQITIAALVLSALVGIIIACLHFYIWVFWLLPIFLFIRMVLNALDGMLAREHHMQSALGTYLNELGDVLSDTFLYLPLCLIPGVSFLLVISLVMLAMLSEMTGIIGIQAGASRRYDGPLGKSDRAFIFGIIGILLALQVLPIYWLNIFFVLINLLLLLTIYNRINAGLREAHA